MCVVSIAWNAHPRWRLIVAGNRDEFHDRTAVPLEPWIDHPSIIAGRDVSSHGTGMGVSNNGRFGVVTNIPNPDGPDPQKASRGALVTDWLARGASPDLLNIFNPFNLLMGDQQGLQYLSNSPSDFRAALGDGVHGLSNAGRDERWPRKDRLNEALQVWLGGNADDPAQLFGVLGDAHAASADTHPMFIRHPVYGTRCSTILAVGRDGAGRITERRFDNAGNRTGESAVTFSWAT